jgi:hypothetical protein
MDQFSTFYWKQIIISSKTSSDRLKLIYKSKKNKKKFNYVQYRTTVQGQYNKKTNVEASSSILY